MLELKVDYKFSSLIATDNCWIVLYFSNLHKYAYIYSFLTHYSTHTKKKANSSQQMSLTVEIQNNDFYFMKLYTYNASKMIVVRSRIDTINSVSIPFGIVEYGYLI